MSDFFTDKSIKIKWKILFAFAIFLPLMTGVISYKFINGDMVAAAKRDTIFTASWCVGSSIMLILIWLYLKKRKKLQ